MSILSRAAKPQREPLICTIVGTAGSGKTSLAATFPKPIVIRTQGEAVPKDLPPEQQPEVMPELSGTVDLWETLKALLNEDHAFQTLVIDSVTGLEQLFVSEILASDTKARGINQALGGYGAGPAAVMANHMRVRKAVEFLRQRKGMHTVFLAHADIARIDPPDSDGYSQYTLRLPGKSIAPYVDNVDLVGFIKQAVILRGDEGSKKAITTGDRVLVTYMTPSTVAKNRLGITEDIGVVKGENPLGEYLTPRAEEAAPKRASKAKQIEKEAKTQEEGVE